MMTPFRSMSLFVVRVLPEKFRVPTMNAGRPREYDEDAVLKRVMDVFWKYGYDDTTYEELVKASRLSRSSLYGAFGGKDEMFDRALALYRDEVQENGLQQFESDETGEGALRGMLRSLKEPYDPRTKGCLLNKTMLRNAAASRMPQQTGAVGNTLARLWRAFTETIGRIGGRKTVTLTNEERAAVLVATIFGVAVIARNGRFPDLIEAISSGAEKLIDADK